MAHSASPRAASTSSQPNRTETAAPSRMRGLGLLGWLLILGGLATAWTAVHYYQ